MVYNIILDLETLWCIAKAKAMLFEIMPTTTRTTRLHRYQSLRSTGRRRRIFDKVFKEYKTILGGLTRKLLYRMAVILDAAIALNLVTGVKRQCLIEKQALDIYHTFLHGVSKMVKDFRNFDRVDQLECTEEVLPGVLHR